MSFSNPRKRHRTENDDPSFARAIRSISHRSELPASRQYSHLHAVPTSAVDVHEPYRGNIIGLTNDNDASTQAYLPYPNRSQTHTVGPRPQSDHQSLSRVEDEFGSHDISLAVMHHYYDQSAPCPSSTSENGAGKSVSRERYTSLYASLPSQRAIAQSMPAVTPPKGSQNKPLYLDPDPYLRGNLPSDAVLITLPSSQYASPHPIPPTSPVPETSVPGPYPNAADAPAITPDGEPVLSEEQQKLLNLMMSRKNVFYTGSAGTGKSTVLRAFVKKATEKKRRVNIVAPTGIAALNVGGQSTWAYAGWTPDSHKRPLQELLASAHGKTSWQRLANTQILIIDETSMVENLHFERLNAVMKEARGSHLPFGGVQVIVTGDLPPVKPFGHCIDCGSELRELKYKDIVYKCPKARSGAERCRNNGRYEDKDKWAFRSDAWKECEFVHVNLTKIHRQSDAEFISILQSLRMGRDLTKQQRHRLLHHKSSTRNAIRLSSKRLKVQQHNDEMFNKLKTPALTYQCLDNFRYRGEHPREVKAYGDSSEKEGLEHTLKALRDHRYDPTVRLKKGMTVLLQTNLDIQAGLVNGSQGVIQGFEPFDPKRMPRASTNIRNSETHDGPTLGGDYASTREEEIKEFIKRAPQKEWPIVRFANGILKTIYADCRVTEVGDKAPRCLLSRTQIPLIPGWAITVHKSQGMTLDKVIVDLKDVFEAGQVYVALSRARTLEGLNVESFPTTVIAANREVIDFMIEKFGPELGPGYC